jgi:multiple sugar transport system ATP-binding protein
MRTGLLQQVGSPKELYDTPVNLFVAGFIGSPAMNFMSGTAEDGKLRTSLGDFTLTDRIRRELEAAGAGRDLIVGIRPESFEDAALVNPDVRSHGITFHTSIDVLESLGSDVYAYFTRDIEGGGMNSAELEELAKDSGRADTGAAGDTVVARIDASTRLREGENAELWVDARAIHVFDPASGRNYSVTAGEEANSGAATVPTGSGGEARGGAVPATEPEGAVPAGENPGGAVPADETPGGTVPYGAEPSRPAAGDAAPGEEVT